MGTSNENLFNFKPSPAGPLFAFKKAVEPEKEEKLFALKSEALGKPVNTQEMEIEEKEEGNVFTNIFEEDEETDERSGDLMDSIIKTEDSESEEKESLLVSLKSILFSPKTFALNGFIKYLPSSTSNTSKSLKQ